MFLSSFIIVRHIIVALMMMKVLIYLLI